jgi:O-acetyl-ADP-ribose deacetylase (regulator of RNase III)
MVTFVKGDILRSPAQVITNPINCVGVMGKGLALEFKKAHSAMFNDYKRRCMSGEVQIGRPYLWEDDTTQILLFPTKNHWREPSSLDGVEEGLKFLAANYRELGITSLALPALGCGNGGLPWDKVRQLIAQHLAPIPDLEVFVYEPASRALDITDPDSKIIPRNQGSEKIAAKPVA